MGRQFTALRVIGTIFKVLGWLALILGLLAAIGALAAGFALGSELSLPGLDLGGPLAGVAAFLVALLASLIYFLVFYAVGETIYLFLNIEENTRRTAYFIQQQYSSPEQTYRPPSSPGAYPE